LDDTGTKLVWNKVFCG